MTSIEENQNKILQAMHAIEEERGQSLLIQAINIEKRTGLTPHQINTALSLLDKEGFLFANEGGNGIAKGHRYSTALITDEGKLRAEKTIVGKSKETVKESKNPRNVFVVHGRDIELRDALFQFLRSLDLHPLEWSELVRSTGTGSPYIGEILDKAFSEAQAIVVLMTPDDEGRLRQSLRGTNEPQHETELTPQSRLNVIFEAGIAIGRCPERTIIVEIGNIRPFSDIAGRHTVRLDESPEKRLDLANRLENAGCLVNNKGTSWLKAGNFATTEIKKFVHSKESKRATIKNKTSKRSTGSASVEELTRELNNLKIPPNGKS
jgi:predicted nucleotide-binding protein